MTLHYRALPDPMGADLGPLPETGEHSPWSYSNGAPYRAIEVNVPVLKPGPALPGLNRRYAHLGKRAFDIVLASVALFLAAPVLVLLSALLWIESGNPFYAQERLGINGKRFRMWKLRTMVQDAEAQLADCLSDNPALRAEWDHAQKLKIDPRVTPIGRLLRKTSMDELPQVFNVLMGDMSLVGPRPMLPDQMPLYRYPQAYLGVRPGITGLWQVTARNEESFDLRAILDLRYAQRLSFGLDLKIIASTFGVIWRATGY